MNVSPSFSPPIKLMKPYFLLAGFFYLLSIASLLFISPFLDLKDFSLIGWVHLYMLGFVMMGIFAAMAQLSPIIIQTQHYSVKIFSYLWIVLTLGIIIMMLGFFINVSFLLWGGGIVLVAMLIYATEFLLTLKSASRSTSITKAMKMSNFFLLLGISTGLVMAAAFNGYIDINPNHILHIHTFGLVLGFVILLIMGISIILIPMFGSSARISEKEFTSSFYTIAFGVVIMMLSPFFYTELLKNIAYSFTIAAILLYIYQLYKMTSSRKRVTHDVWARYMYVAFSSFMAAFFILTLYLFNDNELYLRVGMWLLLIGFFGCVIIGNFYKIIPFLVWFHIYSPLIETQSVPMLHQLLPKRSSELQWFYSFLGVLITTLGLALEDRSLFMGGVILLLVSALMFLYIINKVLSAK